MVLFKKKKRSYCTLRDVLSIPDQAYTVIKLYVGRKAFLKDLIIECDLTLQADSKVLYIMVGNKVYSTVTLTQAGFILYDKWYSEITTTGGFFARSRFVYKDIDAEINNSEGVLYITLWQNSGSAFTISATAKFIK